MSNNELSPGNCPACASDVTKDEIVYNGYLLKRCIHCQLVFTAQRNFSASQYDAVYSDQFSYRAKLDDARLVYEGKKGYKDLSWFKRKALSWLSGRVPQGRSILDLGSGPGSFLMIAQRKFGYNVEGLELASEPAALANSLGIATFCGTVEQFVLQRQTKFHAITSFEVLEHVADPLSFIQAARTLLSEDGILILSVPNLDDPYCLNQQIPSAMPPIHINFFARKSLQKLLGRAGLQLDQTFTLPIPSSSIRNIYGKAGFFARLPYLAAARLMGKMDGTTLLVLASRSKAAGSGLGSNVS